MLVAQAGEYAQHLGRIDVTPDGATASLLPVSEDLPPDTDVLAALAAIEAEAAAYMDEVLCELPEPLDVEAATLWLAEILRERMDADVGLAAPGASFDAGLPGGPLRRRDLWDVCHSSGNPGVVEVSGGQLAVMLERGRDPAFAETTPRPLRGRPQGVLQAVGADGLEPARRYSVAGTDWELDRLGGIADPDWGLRPRYDFPVIVREAIEEHLAQR